MAYRGLRQRIARLERLHAQRSPRAHIVWLKVGEVWDGDISALGDRDHVIVLPRKAPSAEAWRQQVQQRYPQGSTPERPPPHAQESEVSYAPTLYDL
jgi:hypothetical protein